MMKIPQTKTTSTLFGFMSRVLDGFAYPRPAKDYGVLLGRRHSESNDRIAATVVKVQRETSDATSIWLRVARPWQGHQAGQYVVLHLNIDGIWHSRCYSISSPPKNNRIRLTIKTQADGLVSPYIAEHVKKGAQVFVSQAMGDFTIRPPLATSLNTRLFITAGSGITPIMSMLATGILAENNEDIVHVHYAPNKEQSIFSQPLAALASKHKNYQLHTLYTADGDEHFSPQQLEKLCSDWQQRMTWLCGPHSLMEAVSDHWQTNDLAQQLLSEYFLSPTLHTHDAVASEVLFSASQVQTDAAADNLLQLAERAGLQPKFGCRMGICHSCDCRLVEGTVKDLRTGKLTKKTANMADIHIQPCVHVPIGNVELEL